MKLLLLALILGVVHASQVRYDKYKVYKVSPETEEHVEILQHLQDTNFEYDFWSDGVGLNLPTFIMVPPSLELGFLDLLASKNIKYEVYIENVQDNIDVERAAVHPKSMGWTDYYDLDEIYSWLDQLEKDYPKEVSVLSPGISYEKREIKGVKISFSPSNKDNAIFIEGGIHAREWISPAVVTYILNEILTSDDVNVRNTVEKYDWYIFPVFNPDGYVYSKTVNRMWRKTRVPYANGCFGADPNRNWNYRWNTGGASNNPCAETFAGPYAESEPSVSSMASYISTVQDKLIAYLSFHSFSQLLLIPFGHTTDHLANFAELKEVGDIAMEKLESFFGTQFIVGNTPEILYVATGTSVDWVKAMYGTRITYTYELRDTGTYGFVLPANQILPSSIETFASVITLLDEFEQR